MHQTHHIGASTTAQLFCTPRIPKLIDTQDTMYVHFVGTLFRADAKSECEQHVNPKCSVFRYRRRHRRGLCRHVAQLWVPVQKVGHDCTSDKGCVQNHGTNHNFAPSHILKNDQRVSNCTRRYSLGQALTTHVQCHQCRLRDPESMTAGARGGGIYADAPQLLQTQEASILATPTKRSCQCDNATPIDDEQEPEQSRHAHTHTHKER